jgi:hypothetical protein
MPSGSILSLPPGFHLVYIFVCRKTDLSLIFVKLQCLEFSYLTYSIALLASATLVIILLLGTMLAPPRGYLIDIGFYKHALFCDI